MRRGGFATGLEFSNGVKKATYAAFRLPLFLPQATVSHGQATEVWGCVRPAVYPLRASRPVPPSTSSLRHRAERSATISSVAVRDPHGYVDTHVVFPGSGTVRLAWTVATAPRRSTAARRGSSFTDPRRRLLAVPGFASLTRVQRAAVGGMAAQLLIAGEVLLPVRPRVRRLSTLAVALGLLAALLAAVLAQPTAASTTQLAMFEDDFQLQANPEATLDTFKSLGVGIVRVFVAWDRVAPLTRPGRL